MDDKYITELKKSGTLEGKPTCAAAIADFERKYPPGSRYVIDFGGKFKKKKLNEVPAWYIDWLKDKNVAATQRGLAEGLSYFDSKPRTTAEIQAEEQRKRRKRRRHSWELGTLSHDPYYWDDWFASCGQQEGGSWE